MASETADVFLQVQADAKQVFEVFKKIASEAKKLFGNLPGADDKPSTPKTDPVKITNQFSSALKGLIQRLQQEKKALMESRKETERLGADQTKLNAVYGRRESQLNQLLRKAYDLSRADQKGVSDTNKLSNAVSLLTERIQNSASAFSFQEKRIRDTSTASNRLTDNLKRLNLSLAGQGFQQFGSFISSITNYLVEFGRKAYDSALSINALKSTLISLTGSQEAANQKFNEFINLSNTSKGVTLTFASELFNQLKLLRTTDEAIQNLIVSLGKVNAVTKLPTDFALNLTQIFSQGFEEQDIKQALTKVPLFREILKKAFGTDDNENLRELKNAGKLTAETYLREIARAINETPEFANAQENLGVRLEKAFDKLRVAIAPLGELIVNNLITLLNIVVPLVERLSKGFQELSPYVQQFIVAVGLLTVALGPVITAFGSILFGIQSIVTVFGSGGVLAGVGSVLSAIALPLTIIIGLIVAFGVAYKENFLGIQDVTLRVMEVIQNQVTSVITTITEFWNENGQLIINTVTTIYETLEPILKIILALYEAVFSSIIDIVGTAFQIQLNNVLGFIEAVTKLINGDWKGAWDSFTQIATDNQKLVTDLFDSITGYFQNWFDQIKILFYRGLATILEGIVNFLESLPENFTKLFNWIGKELVEFRKYVIDWVKSLPETLGKAVLDLLRWVGQVVISIFNKIKEAFSDPAEIAKLIFVVTTLGASIGQALIGGVIEEIQNGFPRIREAIVGLRDEAQRTEDALNQRLRREIQLSGATGGLRFEIPPEATITPKTSKSDVNKAIREAEKRDDILSGLIEDSAKIKIEQLKDQIRQLDEQRKQTKNEAEISKISDQILQLSRERFEIEAEALRKTRDKIKISSQLKATLDEVASLESQGNLDSAQQILSSIFTGLTGRNADLAKDYLELQRRLVKINNELSNEVVEIEADTSKQIKDIKEDEAEQRIKLKNRIAEANEVFLKDELDMEKQISDSKIDLWKYEADQRLKTFEEAERLIQNEQEKQLQKRIDSLRKERDASVKQALESGEIVKTDRAGSLDVTETSSRDVAQAQSALNKAYRDYAEFTKNREKLLNDSKKKDKDRNREILEDQRRLNVELKELDLELLEQRIDVLKKEESERGIFFTKRKELHQLEYQLLKERETISHQNHLAELQRKKAEIEADQTRLEELKKINELIEAELKRHREAIKNIQNDEKSTTEEKSTEGGYGDFFDVLYQSVESILSPINLILGQIIDKLRNIANSASKDVPKAFKILAGITAPILTTIGNALNQVAQTFIQTGEFSLRELRRLIKEELYILSRQYLVKAIAETAAGFATLFFNPSESAAHFKAAALYGVASAAAGGAGALIGIGTGSKSTSGQTNEGNFSSSPASTGTNGETVKFNERLGELIEVLKNRDNKFELIVKTDEMQLVNIAARSVRRNEGRARLQNITGVYNFNLDG